MGPLPVPQTCRTLQNAMWYLIGDVNPYGLDYPVCHEDGSTKRSHKNHPQQPVRPQKSPHRTGTHASFLSAPRS